LREVPLTDGAIDEMSFRPMQGVQKPVLQVKPWRTRHKPVIVTAAIPYGPLI